MSEDLNKLDGYLIMKRGLYYRPNSCGYTGIRDNAGRYTLAEAQEHADPISGVTFIHESEAEEFSSACYDDLARDHLRAQITDLRQRLQAAEERAEKMREDLALTAALARELFKRDRLIVEGDKLVFTGPWARVGSVSVSDILDRADAALKTEGA